MDEFELIRRYFQRNDEVAGVDVGIGDDGAVLTPSDDQQQIQVIDTLVEGVHFPADTLPEDIAYRAVAVNLSDIAAMGGRPRWMTLALTLNNPDEQWVKSFAAGLFAAADKFDVVLVGGDTTSGPIVTVTVTVTGEVESGAALLRSCANAGDGIYVTGTLGDAAAGLQLLQHGESDDFLVRRFLQPTPRIDIGRKLIGRASAAIDVSDGFVGDLKKLLVASGVGGEIEIEKLPLSDALRQRFDIAEQRKLALTGGDDYELCFTANDEVVEEFADITRIGTVTEATDLVCRLDDKIVDIDDSGYRHFQ
jgi:thiamine-monophosphate kinase